MDKINIWLDEFMSAWKTYSIDKVMALFADDVEYWETPFKKISSYDNLKKEWGYIKSQKNILITCKIFSKEENKYTVIWELKYINPEENQVRLKGIYLIKLNDEGKCNYFYHCGES